MKQLIAWLQFADQHRRVVEKRGGTLFHFCIGPKPIKWECFLPQTRVYISVEKKSWKYFSAFDTKGK